MGVGVGGVGGGPEGPSTAPMDCTDGSVRLLRNHPHSAGMDQVGLAQCSTVGKGLLFAVVAGFMLNGGFLLANSGLPPVIRAAGVVQLLLGCALGGVCYQGGIIDDNADRPEVARPGGDAPPGEAVAAAAGTA